MQHPDRVGIIYAIAKKLHDRIDRNSRLSQAEWDAAVAKVPAVFDEYRYRPPAHRVRLSYALCYRCGVHDSLCVCLCVYVCVSLLLFVIERLFAHRCRVVFACTQRHDVEAIYQFVHHVFVMAQMPEACDVPIFALVRPSRGVCVSVCVSDPDRCISTGWSVRQALWWCRGTGARLCSARSLSHRKSGTTKGALALLCSHTGGSCR